jgi:hypothetical protein
MIKQKNNRKVNQHKLNNRIIKKKRKRKRKNNNNNKILNRFIVKK